MFTIIEAVPQKPATKRRALLKNWSISCAMKPARSVKNHKKNQASDKLWMTFKGQVFGHPSFENGEYIETSPVLHIDTVAGVAETMHTLYRLG